METTTNPETMIGKIFDVTGLAKRQNGRYVVDSFNARMGWFLLLRLGKDGKPRTGMSPISRDNNGRLWSPEQLAAKIAAGTVVEVTT